jgi:hypothetical protein
VFHEAAVELLGELDDKVVAGACMHRLRRPTEQPCVEGARARNVPRAELEVNDGMVRRARCHRPVSWDRRRAAQLIGAAMISNLVAGPLN